MKIEVNVAEKVRVKFVGKINLSQEITLSKEDSKKLAEILQSGQSDSFETS